MNAVTLFATIFLALHVDSYILLTATLDDVNAIARQLSQSPVADQAKRIWRRASSAFYQELAKTKGMDAGQKRSTDIDDTKDFSVLGKNVSYYLSALQDMVKGLN